VLRGSSDEQLVDLVLDGDDEAFEVLFDRHVADAVWFARDVLGSWGEAEEAVRHSFAAARAYMASRDRDIDFAPWLHTILSNHCLSMLQARGPAPGGGRAAVVDLDKWRRQRKRLGLTAPVAASAGLRDSVMAACGIGTAATATSAPLIGGTLAKLTIVALLAGGAGGVAGQAVPEDQAPAAGRGAVAVEPAGADVTAWAGGPASAAPGTVPRSTGFQLRTKRAAPVTSPRPPPAPKATPPVAGAPKTETPTTQERAAPGGGSPVASAPAVPVDRVVHASPAAGSPLRGAVQGVTDLVGGRAPAPTAVLPAPVDLPAIGDDLRVTTDRLTADVRALLSHGTNAPPQ